MKKRSLFTPERIRISRATIQSQSLMGILSWAAEYKVAYNKALKTIVPLHMPFLVRLAFVLLSPFIWVANKLMNSKYKRLMISGIKPFFKSALESAILDLQNGRSLSYALETHLRWWLPEHYIQSIKLAEDKDCVREVLLLLGETSSKIRKRRREIVNQLFYPFLVVSFALFISWVLGQRIIWKCSRIFDDLSNGQEFPYISILFRDFARSLDFDSPIFLFTLLQIPWLIYIFGFTHRGDWLLVKIPFIRRSIIRWKMINVLQGLSIYSKLKVPLHESLGMIIDSEPNSSLKNSLEKIRLDILRGIDLKVSWLTHFPNDHLTNFYVKSGMKIDKFSESLDHLTVILVEEDNRKHSIFAKSLEPIMLLLVTFFVAFIVFAMFLPMISLFEIGASLNWDN